jgi:hypothetical protein
VKWCLALVFLAGCRGEVRRDDEEPVWPAEARELCVTQGDVAPRARRLRIDQPAARGFARATSGDAASLDFTYVGPTDAVAALASGDVRAQLGLKLRAQDSCNLIYVMWRVAPKAEVVVQIKRNPGKTAHEACGASGYVRVRPARRAKPTPLAPGSAHTFAASITDDELSVWVDHRLSWRGVLPEVARELRGPAGFRTDNVEIELALRAPAVDGEDACPRDPRED